MSLVSSFAVREREREKGRQAGSSLEVGYVMVSYRAKGPGCMLVLLFFAASASDGEFSASRLLLA